VLLGQPGEAEHQRRRPAARTSQRREPISQLTVPARSSELDDVART
jgi:hypothetical protein